MRNLALALTLLLGLAGRGSAKKIHIMASVGQTSARTEVVTDMLFRGARFFRFNLAHKDRRLAVKEASIVAAAAKGLGVRVPMLFDLPGGKVRSGPPAVGGQVTLASGQPFTLVYGARGRPSTAQEATVDYPWLGRHVAVGDRVLLHQGKLELEVVGAAPGRVETKILRGGVLRGRATVDVVGKEMPFPRMTAVDRRKLGIAVAAGATHVGVSMVQRADQMRAVRRALVRLGAPQTKVVAKIETRAALENLEAIVREADMVMIARGDLATAVGTQEALRAAEERIAEVSKRQGKPFIDATGFEGPGAAAEVARAKALGPDFILLKTTAIEPDPAEIVGRLSALLGEGTGASSARPGI